MTFEKKSLIQEGKSKILYETNDPGKVIVLFKDDATAFNGQKKAQLDKKGLRNNQISNLLFQHLEKNGVPTHLLQKISDLETLARKLKIIPIEVVVRNKAAGSLVKRLGLEKGEPLSPPLIEYFLKSDPLGDPLVGEGHITYFGWATEEDLEQMRAQALRVNGILRKVFESIGLELIDFKLEFGKDAGGKMYLADEFTPDGCRLWDLETKESMDKDRFRQDLGKVEEAYEEVCRRLETFFGDKS